MTLEIIALPDTRIRQKSREVISFDRSLDRLIADLVQTAETQENPQALGLAASQVGFFKKVFVARIQNKFRAFVNAQIVKRSKEESALLEGCFSVKGIYGHVMRPSEITLVAQDKNGRKIKRNYKGFAAKIIQHEIDHADGVLFVDHVHQQNGQLFRIEKDKKGKEQLVEIAYV